MIPEIARNDLNQARLILVNAFQNDPTMNCFLPQDERHEEALQRLFGFLVELSGKHGFVHLNKDHTGVVIWWYSRNAPIGYCFLFVKLFSGKLRNVTGSLMNSLKYAYFVWTTIRNTPQFDHIYIDDIAVHSEMRGNGIGSKLLDEVIREADRMNYPIYLENTKEENLPFYEKHGFKILSIVKGSFVHFTYWRMLRPEKYPNLPIGKEVL